MGKGFLIAAGFLLAVVLVVTALKILDESKYRTCLEEGGWPKGQELTVDQAINQAIDGAPRKTCFRRLPF